MLLLVVIATLIVLLALLILFHQNLNATKGYKLRSLEHARSELLLEQEVLTMKIAKSQSLVSLEEDPQVKGMQEPKKMQYVRTEREGGDDVAVKN